MNNLTETILCATVLESRKDSLLVSDNATNQQIVVHAQDAPCYAVGCRVCIHFNGVMTLSLPPQIAADRITLLSPASC